MNDEATGGAILGIEPIEGGLRITGEIDLSNIDRFAEEVRAAASPGHDLVLDLSRCEYMGSEGIGALIEAWKIVREGGRLVVRAPQPTLRRVLDLAGLGRFPNLELADA